VGVPDLPVRVERSRSFSSTAQLAERWRSGYDLGWRLAWVLRGWAAPALLDAYEAERRPVVEYTAARSADPRGSIRPAEREVRADLGGRIPHAWSQERSTLDLLARSDGTPVGVLPAGGDRVASLRAAVAAVAREPARQPW
jgi:putative polyketide hydroxylase